MIILEGCSEKKYFRLMYNGFIILGNFVFGCNIYIFFCKNKRVLLEKFMKVIVYFIYIYLFLNV